MVQWAEKGKSFAIVRTFLDFLFILHHCSLYLPKKILDIVFMIKISQTMNNIIDTCIFDEMDWIAQFDSSIFKAQFNSPIHQVQFDTHFS